MKCRQRGHGPPELWTRASSQSQRPVAPERPRPRPGASKHGRRSVRGQPRATRLSAVPGAASALLPAQGLQARPEGQGQRLPRCRGPRGPERHSRRSRAAEFGYRWTDGRTDGRVGADPRPPPSVAPVPPSTCARLQVCAAT